MPDNTQLITKPEPKYRKKLNQGQLAVLQLLYRFRFATSEQVAKYQGKQSNKFIQKRLKILEDQMLIAKRYDRSYKLKGKPAAYYLLPKGARTLEATNNRKSDEPITIRRIYKDKVVTDGFIAHCLNVLDVYQALKALYPAHGKLNYFTKSQLSYEKYDYFPTPLQDAYIRLATNTGEKDFLLDIFEDNQPFFVLIRRIKKYLDYAGSGTWAGNDKDNVLPTILMVVENKSAHKRLRKRLAKELRESYEELAIATTSLAYILNPEYSGRVWLPIDEYGEDPDEPVRPMSLTRLPRTGN